jgi:hypothetical protein
VEGSPNTHIGQGAANRRIFFESGFLERPPTCALLTGYLAVAAGVIFIVWHFTCGIARPALAIAAGALYVLERRRRSQLNR